MYQMEILSFPSNTRWGRAGNFLLILLGPIGFPVFSAALFYAMTHGPYPASYLHPLFGAAIILLYLGNGPFWAFAALFVSTVMGLAGAFFAISFSSRLLFLLNIALMWGVFLLLVRLGRHRQTIVNKFEEEADKLDLDITRFSSDTQELQDQMEDANERAAAFMRLHFFTDDLIGAYSKEELMAQARNGLQSLFPKASVEIHVFADGAPLPTDKWSSRALRAPVPALYPSRRIDTPSSDEGTFMFVPLQAKDRVAGWLELETKPDARPFRTQDLRLAVVAAKLIALALGNADLFRETEALATTDSLTGLYTRGYFSERLLEEFVLARHRGIPLSLLMLDIDHFKTINDTHGHQLGDEVLRWISQLIATQARETDFVARYGGDEFAVLLPNTDSAKAMEFARRLCKKVDGAFFPWQNKKILLGVSGGVSTLNKSITVQTDLIHKADDALYQAKKLGRNRVVLAS